MGLVHDCGFILVVDMMLLFVLLLIVVVVVVVDDDDDDDVCSVSITVMKIKIMLSH